MSQRTWLTVSLCALLGAVLAMAFGVWLADALAETVTDSMQRITV